MTSELEVRSNGDHVTIEGYASTFNQPYNMGWYEETVRSGAFSRTLGRNPDVRLLVNHDGLPLARTKSGTLDLSQDSTGLHVRSVLDGKDPDVKRLVPKMQRRDLSEMSFAFGVVEDEWDSDFTKRSLNALNLDGGDVSIVTYPANPNATVSIRSKMLEDGPERLRMIYRSLTESDQALTAELRSVLENLAVELDEDETVLQALAGIADWPVTDLTDTEAERQAAIDVELRRRRLTITRLK